MVADEGPIPASAQQGLKETLRAQGHFLACVCKVAGELKVRTPSESLQWATHVISSEDIGAAVRVIRLHVPNGFSWRAGQFITLMRGDWLSRSYSVASIPEDGYIELHVRKIPNGAMSSWLHDELGVGDPIQFRGPVGDCFYTPGNSEQPLVLAGTGTGLAPLYGILRDALRNDHSGSIALFHGAVNASGLYFVEKLRGLAARHANVRYTPCLLDGSAGLAIEAAVGPLDDIVMGQGLDLKASKAFLCGDPGLVQKLRKRLFLKGMSNKSIFADAFVPSAK